MLNDLHIRIPFVGEIYLEYRCSTCAIPFCLTAKHKEVLLFCIGPLCGGITCPLIKKDCDK